jgi:hypothetical protein
MNRIISFGKTVYFLFTFTLFFPFNINRWYSDSGIIQFLRLSSYGVVVALILLFTQFPLRKMFKMNFFTVKTFLLWLSIEIILISLVYIFLYGNPLGNFMNDLGFSVKYTLLGICLPYSFSLLFIHYKNQYIEMELLRKQILKPIPDRFIVLRDEKGKIRFSVPARDLLFLESADNYVIVNYLLNDKPKRKIFLHLKPGLFIPQ